MSAKHVRMEQILETVADAPGISWLALLAHLKFNWMPAIRWVAEDVDDLIKLGHLVVVGSCPTGGACYARPEHASKARKQIKRESTGKRSAR